MTTFAPSRLTLARQRRHMTCREFANKLGITPLTVSRIEAGKNKKPTEETIQKIIEVTGFPRAFFFAKDLDPGGCETVSFRSLAAMKARERDAALAAIPLACLLDDWLRARFNIPESDLMDFSSDTPDPERAAIVLRRHWGLGEQPIASMVRLLESKGVRIFSLAEETMNVDAFSCWRGNVPFVFLNTMKTAERGRFDSAHELGHLVLHRHKGAESPEAEDEANRFASSFLLPHAGVSAHVGRISSIDPLIPIKKHWGVSLAALVYRLHKMGRLSDWQNRMFCVQMSRRGYRSNEPDGLRREESSVWKTVLEYLWKDGITKDHIAAELNLPLFEIENLISGLIGSPMPEKPPSSGGARQKLRLVQ